MQNLAIENETEKQMAKNKARQIQNASFGSVSQSGILNF